MADIPIEHELIKQAAALVDLQAIDTKIDHFMENTRVRITMQEDPEVMESCALGLIFTFGVLSFLDAKPRGVSADYADGVLTLRVPIAEKAKPRRIEVSRSGGRKAIDATSEDDGAAAAVRAPCCDRFLLIRTRLAMDERAFGQDLVATCVIFVRDAGLPEGEHGVRVGHRGGAMKGGALVPAEAGDLLIARKSP